MVDHGITPTKEKRDYEQELRRMTVEIVRNYQPEKIILFGSGITGKVNRDSDSDIDLLIIKKTNQKRLYRRGEALKGIPRTMPLDLIILTPQELNILTEKRSLFIKHILEHGKVVYEKEKSMV